MVAAGEKLAYDGDLHQLPLPDSQGRALRSPVAGAEVPIFVASIGPANLRLTGELADGWIGTAFIPESAEVYLDPIGEGAVAGGRTLGEVELTAPVTLEFTDDLDEAGRRHAAGYAFTIGAMGSPSTNFYNRAFERQGFGDDVQRVYDLWQRGDRDAAGAAVPTEIGMRTNLLGGDASIIERLRAYRAVGDITLRVAVNGDDRIDQIGRLLDLVNSVNAEPKSDAVAPT